MKMTRLAAVSALTIAALGVAGGTSYAAPTSPPAITDTINVDLAPHVNYKANQVGDAAIITTDAGTLTVQNGQFQIRAASGEILAGAPLEYYVDDIAFPIDAQISGNTATLTPSIDVSRAWYHPAAMPFENQAPWKTPYEREVAAWSRMTTTISMGAAIGTLTGAVVGAGGGCVVGALAGLAATAALLTIFGAGPLAGCVVGALALGPLGALAGAIFVGAPIAIAAGAQYFTTINQPFVPAK